jgi:acetyl/propionyl-CoA carboxylase alpha subunit
MFHKILIANRGEIACRVAATARRLGIRTVAVYSDADANARHVRACDEAVHIGASAPRESYLRWERILEAARATGAQAIHPGYGFLSENEDFAQACADARLVFIGPPPAASRDMGSSAAAKALRDHSTTNPLLVLKGGVIAGKTVNADSVKALADLPSREVLLSMLAGAIKAPLTKTANLLQAPARRAAYGIKALIDSKEAA